MSQEEPYINGDLLRLNREAQGWSLSDMATRACMSVKQIRQLEEGGMSSFYSAAVKVTSAKKVGTLLGVSADEVLGLVADVEEVLVEETAGEEALKTEALAVDAAAPIVAEIPQASVTEAAHVAHPMTSEDAPHAAVVQPEAPKAKTSIWVIAGLFVAALAVAAYLQPKEEPATEPPPPLQVVPTEATDAASAAEAPASTASDSASMPVAPAVQKPASAVVTTSAPAVLTPSSGVSSAPRVATPALAASAAAASAVRPVVPASALAMPAPSASKAP